MEDFISREMCYQCYRPISSCVCKYTSKALETNSKFVILMHPKEFKKTKNGTGHITNNSLTNCELHIGIDFSRHPRINELISDSNYEPYLLYPGEDTIKLNKEKLINDKKPLIFIIDSTWPCSKKILRLSTNLHNLKKISFEHNKSSQFKIKTQPNQYCLSTIESTLCVIEELNKQDVESISQNSLDSFLTPFEKMVDYQVNCIIKEHNSVRYKRPYKKFV